MILVHPLFTDPIEIQNNKINIVILEHQHLFTKFIAEIFTQVNDGTGPFLLSQDGKKLDFSKNMDIVVDVFNLTVNQKKVINKLHSSLLITAQESEHYLTTSELLTNINVYLDEIIQDQSLALTYNEALDIAGIFKAADVRFAEEQEYLPEKLIDYMEVMTEYCNIECFAFVNLKSYMLETELKNFYRDVLYKRFKVILLESRIDSEIYELKDLENILILDKDLCEF